MAHVSGQLCQAANLPSDERVKRANVYTSLPKLSSNLFADRLSLDEAVSPSQIVTAASGNISESLSVAVAALFFLRAQFVLPEHHIEWIQRVKSG